MREVRKGKMVAIHHTPFLGRRSSISSTGNAGRGRAAHPKQRLNLHKTNAYDDTSPLSWDERGASEASGVCGRRGRARWSQFTARRSSDASHQSRQRGLPGEETGGHPKQRLNLHKTNAEDDRSPLSWDERGASEASGGCPGRGGGRSRPYRRTDITPRSTKTD